MNAASIHTAVGLMSQEDMSAVLQVSPQTLATWRCKKRGPPSIKLGKKVFYMVSEFNTWTQKEADLQRSKKAPAHYNPEYHSSHKSVTIPITEDLRQARMDF
jgi:hypothetical protein